jgi:hypothetical protein
MATKEQILLEDRAIKDVITEELGINDEVRKLTFDLTRIVIENYDGSGKFVTDFDAFGKKYRIVLFLTDYPKLSMCPGGGEDPYAGITYFDYQTITINGFTAKGRILKEKLSEAIQHEIHHVFDLVMAEKDGFFDSNTKRKTYITGARQATNPGIPKIQKYIGYAVYMWHDFESRAFENGTYSYIMSSELNFPGEEFDVAKKSSYYKRITWIREAYDFVVENQEEATRIAESIYGKTYNWLVRTVGYSLKECRRQFGRAVAKAGNDYDWTHDGKTLITI